MFLIDFRQLPFAGRHQQEHPKSLTFRHFPPNPADSRFRQYECGVIPTEARVCRHNFPTSILIPPSAFPSFLATPEGQGYTFPTLCGG